MRFSTLLAPALATLALAAPTYPELGDEAVPRNLDAVSEYFNLLARKVQITKATSFIPQCDLSKAKMPIGVFCRLSVSIPTLLLTNLHSP